MNNDWFISKDNPEPLTKEEYVIYFNKARKGDEKAREKIILHNIRLVKYRIKTKFSHTIYEINDLVSIGIIGLIKAVDNFDITRNINFISFASICIDNEILMYMKKNKKFNNDISFEHTVFINSDDNNNLALESILCDDRIDVIGDYETKEEINIIREVLNELSCRDKKIIMLYYGFYNDILYTQTEISKICGLSQSQVSRSITRINNKLKKLLMEKYFDMSSLNNTLEKDTLPNDTSEKEHFKGQRLVRTIN